MSQPFTIRPVMPGAQAPSLPAGNGSQYHNYTVPFNRKAPTAPLTTDTLTSTPFRLHHPPVPVSDDKQPKAAEKQHRTLVNGNALAWEKEEEPENKVGFLGYLFPILTMVGTPLMFGAMLLGVKNKKIPNLNWFKKIYKPTSSLIVEHLPEKTSGFNYWLGQKFRKIPALKNASDDTLIKMYKLGRGLIALGIIPKAIIGFRFGITSQQPSIIMSKILELLLAPLILIGSGMATAFNAFIGAIFTAGFTNDMDNRPLAKEDGPAKPKRVYDMTRFLSVFKRDSGVALVKRPFVFMDEMARMTKFSIQDNWVAMKRVTDNLKKARRGEKNDLVSLHPNDAAAKSSAAIFLTYLATVPNMIVTLLPDTFGAKKAIDIVSKVLSGMSGLLSEFSFITFSRGGRNILEQLPAVGSTLEISSTIMGYTQNPVMKAFATGLQQFAAAINSVFYAHRSKDDSAPTPGESTPKATEAIA